MADKQKYSITEDRTYTCLKDDKSVSLNDLTPQHISDASYWKFMQYNVGEFVMILEDSAISSNPSYQRPSELEEGTTDPSFTPLYTKGIYKCIAVDYDIKLAKVKTTTQSPTQLDADSANPLCFGKYVDVILTDGTVQRVNIALQKWQRTGNLPSA